MPWLKTSCCPNQLNYFIMMAPFGLKVHVHKRTHTTGKNRGEKEKEISALRKLIAVFGAVRQNYAWNGKKSLPFISPHPFLTLRACTWEIEIGRLWCAKREREFSVCMCESALQFPSGWHCCWIYPFPPCELDLTRLHNICMGAAEFMYTVEAVFERCVCVCVWGRWFLFLTICFEICAVGRVY